MELTGRIISISDVQTFGSGFQKKSFVIETEEQYPQKLEIDLTGDRLDIVDTYKPGERVTVGINLRGREYNGKYYTNISGWKVVRPEAANAVRDIKENLMGGNPQAKVAKKVTATPQEAFLDDDDDGLPF